TKYGPFRSDGTAAVIVRFGNQPQYLKFGDQILDYGYSPLFGVIPEGEGIISVTDMSDYPSLISFGGTWL
ncbi:MAG: hypothetical protein K2L54_00475, partial [Clostridiales bacterium]|nr:hypothetical protein [Clostridiales bacterium]